MSGGVDCLSASSGLVWSTVESFGRLVGMSVRFFRVCLVVIVLLFFLSVCGVLLKQTYYD